MYKPQLHRVFKLKSFLIWYADPKKDKANLLQVHEIPARDKYENAKESARAPPQNPENIIKEARFIQIRKFLS